MGKFDGILICTDLDGTLLNNDKSISEENLRAIEYFKSEGGRFTFVTGRLPYYVGKALDLVRPNAPIGCANGGGVFDFATDEYVWQSPLGREALPLVKHIDGLFPNVGIQAVCYRKTYFCKENVTMKHFRAVTGLENLVLGYYDVKEPIAKIIFGSDDGEELSRVEAELRSHPLAGDFDFVRSERTLFEILPKGIGKGVALEKLCEHLGIDKKKSVAVGDYDNDISMLISAGVGIAVKNASRAALEAADFVTVSNEQHAIREVIWGIENGKYIRI